MIWNLIVPVFMTMLYGGLATRYGHQDHCQNQKAQTGVDINQIMGIWHGIQVFYHRDRFQYTEHRHDEPVCPLINLSIINYSPMEVSLVWQDPSDSFLEYRFRIHTSVWISMHHGDKEGFNGQLRVLKAVSDHMVLSFCSTSDHYSVLLSRDKYLDYSTISSVQDMMERYNLPIYNKTRQCNGAASYSNSLLSIVLLLLVCWYRS